MTRREEIEQQAEMFRQLYRGSGNYSTSMDIKNAFQEGVEWADKTMIDKVCEILKNVTVTYNKRFFGKCEENAFDTDFIKEFRQAMEE